MSELDKPHDRKSWLTWAIEFLRRGLWLDEEFTVHGPHDPSGSMWGSAPARIDAQEDGLDCSFRAFANHSKYRPIRPRIWNTDAKDERFHPLKQSELSPNPQKCLLVPGRTWEK